jgi:hypothetical protein
MPRERTIDELQLSPAADAPPDRLRSEFAERQLWKYSAGAGHSGLMLAGLDHLAPFLGFFGDELVKIGGRERSMVARHLIA